MKIVFDVSEPAIEKLPRLIAEMSRITCLMQVDYKKSTVTAIVSDVTVIDSLVDLIETSFTIKKVDIITSADSSENSVKTKSCNVTSEGVNSSNNAVSVSPKEPVLNSKLDEKLDKLARIVNKLVNAKGIDSCAVMEYLDSFKNELNFRYDKQIKTVSCNVGDIVDVNCGMHLVGENSGFHMYAIVANILNDMIYLIPLCCEAAFTESMYKHYIRLEKDIDFEYYSGVMSDMKYEYALLENGQNVNVIRVNRIVGKCSKTFLFQLFECLPEAFCFGNTDNMAITDASENTTSTPCASTEKSTTTTCDTPEDITTTTCDTTEDSVSSPCDTPEATKSTKKASKSYASIIREYILKKEEFSINELKNEFPNISAANISATVRGEVKNGTVIATDKRGQYVVKK